MARITLQTPDGNAFEADLTAATMTVGRADDNDLEIPDGSVSSHHGQFSNENGQWIFTDLGSTNGTKINGERVERLELGDGASFEIGSVITVFHDDVPAAVPASLGGTAPRTATSAAGGFGSTPIERAARTSFGPKVKATDKSRAVVMALGIVALLITLGFGAMLFSRGLTN